MTQTATGKRILTKVLTDTINALVHATTVQQAVSWVVQQDISIIGVRTRVSAQIAGAELAEVGGYEAVVEVSRSAVRNTDSSLMQSALDAAWAAAGVCPANSKGETVMFPSDYRVDMDQGESINMLVEASSRQAALNTQDFVFIAHIYYVLQ